MLNETIDIFFKIPHPDEANIVLLFNACARIATKDSLALVKKVFSNLPKHHRNRLNIMINAFNAYIKCDDLSNAEQIFFPKLIGSTKSSGNLMTAYNKNREPEKTLNLYRQMKINGTEINSVIYLLLINACSQIGILSVSESI